MSKFIGRIRFFVDLPSFVILVALAALFWKPVAGAVFSGVSWVNRTVEPPAWVGSLLLGILGNIIAAAVIGAVLYWLFKKATLNQVCGTFEAFDIRNGESERWGKLTLRHQLVPLTRLAPRLRFELVNEDVTVLGEGLLTREQHFIGFYREVSKLARRRMGAFFMTLDGSGDAYDGEYVYLDPTTNTPTRGTARWVRKN